MSSEIQTNPQEFQIEDEGERIKIHSSYGAKTFYGGTLLGQSDHYQLAIPISALVTGDFNENSSVSQARQESKNQKAQEHKKFAVKDNQRLVFIANEFFKQKQFFESLEYVEELLRRDQNSAKGWMMRGSLLHLLGKPDDAMASWSKAAQLDPNNPDLIRMLKGVRP